MGIVAALAVIVFGVLVFIVLTRRRPTPERLGFAALTEISPRGQAIADRLFAKAAHSVFHKREADRELYLMFVDFGGSDSPDCVVGFADITTPLDTRDIAILHSERQIPKILRRLQGGMFRWARPIDPAIDSLRPGTGWFWYAAEDGSAEDTAVARALAQSSRDRGSGKLLGLALLGSSLIVWASLPHIDAVVSCLESLIRDQNDGAKNDGL